MNTWWKRTVCALALLLSAHAHAEAQDWKLEAGARIYPYAEAEPAKLSPHVLIYLPNGFQHTRSALIVALHGSGNRGSDAEKLKSNLILKYASAHPDFPFIVAVPQAPASAEAFDGAAVNALIDELLARLPADPARVYLTGSSMGGTGTWRTAIDYPSRFAAVAPVSSKVDPGEACRIGRTPVWAFHNEQDKLHVLEPVRRAVEEVRQCGGNAKLTTYPKTGHDAWTETYANPALYEWLAAQHR